jgi:hypothetical protein
MKTARTASFLILLSCLGSMGVVYAQGAPVSPQSLAGDWEYVVNPPLKLVLHLRVDASGALSGTVDTPDSPPKHIELANVRLAGKILTYSMPPQPGTFTEVISADGKKMLGPYMWVKASAAEPAAPPQLPLAQVAGDWEPPGAGSSAMVLRLRLDASGALTGTIDMPQPMATRLQLSNVLVSGRTLSYTMPDGQNHFQGLFSSDGKTVTATGQSTVDATWRQVRTAAQATARDSASSSIPTNGVWTGTGSYAANFPGVGPTNGTIQLTFHFASNPASCSVDLTDKGNPATVPCQMTLTGNTVHIDRVIGFAATFTGTLSPDGNHLSGSWTMGANWHWTGPMEIELTRTSPR